MRYIRLWQALVDAIGEGNLANVGALVEHNPKELDRLGIESLIQRNFALKARVL